MCVNLIHTQTHTSTRTVFYKQEAGTYLLRHSTSPVRGHSVSGQQQQGKAVSPMDGCIITELYHIPK